jgi:NADPH-dependent 2,4-dienoyl-CoA reductase/sulfur reductase-like enzyme
VRLESWQNAQDQGVTTGRIMAGAPPLPATVPWAWSDQYDLNLQVAGLYGPHAQCVVRGSPAEGGFTAFMLEDGLLTGAITLNRGKDMALVRRMLARRPRPPVDKLADPAAALRALAD